MTKHPFLAALAVLSILAAIGFAAREYGTGSPPEPTLSKESVTESKAAESYGYVVSHKNRIRIACIEAGFPYRTYGEQHPEKAEHVADLKSRYSDSYARGVSDGVKMADEQIAVSLQIDKRSTTPFSMQSVCSVESTR